MEQVSFSISISTQHAWNWFSIVFLSLYKDYFCVIVTLKFFCFFHLQMFTFETLYFPSSDIYLQDTVFSCCFSCFFCLFNYHSHKVSVIIVPDTFYTLLPFKLESLFLTSSAILLVKGTCNTHNLMMSYINELKWFTIFVLVWAKSWQLLALDPEIYSCLAFLCAALILIVMVQCELWRQLAKSMKHVKPLIHVVFITRIHTNL
jgi:hypothetical protein